MIDLKKFESKIARYKQLKAQLPALEAAVKNVEEHCSSTIRGNWGLCRMSKHGKVFDQVAEVLRNVHTPENMKIALNQLHPLLTKAHNDLRETKGQASRLWLELSASADSLLSQVQAEISRIREKIYARLVKMLAPFTNEHNARDLAKDTDVYKGLEFISSNLVNSDPEASLNMIKSALSSAAQYRALLK